MPQSEEGRWVPSQPFTSKLPGIPQTLGTTAPGAEEGGCEPTPGVPTRELPPGGHVLITGWWLLPALFSESLSMGGQMSHAGYTPSVQGGHLRLEV